MAIPKLKKQNIIDALKFIDENTSRTESDRENLKNSSVQQDYKK